MSTLHAFPVEALSSGRRPFVRPRVDCIGKLEHDTQCATSGPRENALTSTRIRDLDGVDQCGAEYEF